MNKARLLKLAKFLRKNNKKLKEKRLFNMNM